MLASVGGLSTSVSGVIAVTVLCAAWWVLEPIPIPATSMLPFALLPICGAASHKTVAAAYGHPMVLLLLGGFLLSAALEESGVHRRIALALIRLTGTGGRRLILGFMIATAICSMWISNTATTLMMLPIAIAVVPPGSAMSAPLFLGIAYSASIGGIGTPIGTPPNMVLMGVYEEMAGGQISFLNWMMIGVPVVLFLLPIAWIWLTRNAKDSTVVELPRQGLWRSAEKRSLFIFALAALLWMTRQNPAGGWSAWAGLGKDVHDSTVAMGCAALLFIVPSGDSRPLLTWERARQIPWGILLLFGGGIAIAKGFESTGLSTLLGRFLIDDIGLLNMAPVLMMALIALTVTFLTEVTSNTATTTLLMPILATAGLSAGVDPVVLMLPAALSASCAFMLPVATAPNAIVYGSGRVSTALMAREGVVLNLIGAFVIVVVLTVFSP